MIAGFLFIYRVGTIYTHVIPYTVDSTPPSDLGFLQLKLVLKSRIPGYFHHIQVGNYNLKGGR
jgi:hypothetical protein